MGKTFAQAIERGRFRLIGNQTPPPSDGNTYIRKDTGFRLAASYRNEAENTSDEEKRKRLFTLNRILTSRLVTFCRSEKYVREKINAARLQIRSGNREAAKKPRYEPKV